MNNNFLLRRKKLVIYGSIFILLVFGAGLFQIFSINKQLIQKIHDTRVQIAIYEQERLNSEETRKDYNLIQKDLDSLDQSFVSKNDLISLITRIESVATRHSVSQDITLVDTLQQNKTEIPFTITLTGTYSNIIAYLHEIITFPEYLIFDDISLSGSASSILASIKVVIYTP